MCFVGIVGSDVAVGVDVVAVAGAAAALAVGSTSPKVHRVVELPRAVVRLVVEQEFGTRDRMGQMVRIVGVVVEGEDDEVVLEHGVSLASD